MPKVVKMEIKDKDLKALNDYKNKNTLLSHVDLQNACIIFENNKTFLKKDEYINAFLKEISEKHVDTKKIILRDYFPYFEKLFFLLETIPVKNTFYSFLIDYYVNKIDSKSISKEKISNLQKFMSDNSEQEIKSLKKVKKESLLQVMLSIFKKD